MSLCSVSRSDIVGHRFKTCDTSSKSSMGNSVIRHVLFGESSPRTDTSVRPGSQMVHFWQYRELVLRHSD